MRWQGARGSLDGLLGCQPTHNREDGNNRDEPSDPDDDAGADIVEGRVGIQAGEGAAIVIGRLGKGVEHLA